MRPLVVIQSHTRPEGRVQVERSRVRTVDRYSAGGADSFGHFPIERRARRPFALPWMHLTARTRTMNHPSLTLLHSPAARPAIRTAARPRGPRPGAVGPLLRMPCRRGGGQPLRPDGTGARMTCRLLASESCHEDARALPCRTACAARMRCSSPGIRVPMSFVASFRPGRGAASPGRITGDYSLRL